MSQHRSGISPRHVKLLLTGHGCNTTAAAFTTFSERVLGKEHPDTLTSMNPLASVLSNQGKYVEVEAMHGQAL